MRRRCVAGSVFLLVRSWHIYRAGRRPDRSLKFLRAAYVWLFLSLGMLALVRSTSLAFCPVWRRVRGAMGFSHAYYGDSPCDHRGLHQPDDRRRGRQGRADPQRRRRHPVALVGAVSADQQWLRLRVGGQTLTDFFERRSPSRV